MSSTSACKVTEKNGILQEKVKKTAKTFGNSKKISNFAADF